MQTKIKHFTTSTIEKLPNSNSYTFHEPNAPLEILHSNEGMEWNVEIVTNFIRVKDFKFLPPPTKINFTKKNFLIPIPTHSTNQTPPKINI
ncbi:hypothetical protein Hanom_Chr09g00864131 [Helianthus anomalus]